MSYFVITGYLASSLPRKGMESCPCAPLSAVLLWCRVGPSRACQKFPAGCVRPFPFPGHAQISQNALHCSYGLVWLCEGSAFKNRTKGLISIAAFKCVGKNS